MNSLILGAGGFLGLNLVDGLLAAGEVPRCGRRARGNVLGLRRRPVPLVHVDLEDVEALSTAMKGSSTVFHLAGHYPRLSLDRQAALATGLRQTRNVLEAAAAARVSRLVYVSSTATVAPSPIGLSTELDVHETLPGHGTYHDLKWAMEEIILAERRFEVTVACPGACLGPHDLKVGTSALLLALARGFNPPHPDGIVNLVDARDVATALIRLAWHPSPPRRVILAGGNWWLQSLLSELAVRYGVAPPSEPMTAQESIELADLEEVRAATGGGRPQLSREIVDLILRGVPVSTRLAETSLSMCWRPLTETLESFEAWARRMRMLPASQQQQERRA